MDTSHLREDYRKGQLVEEAAPTEPLPLFHEWLAAAIDAGLPEPHAMTLATATADGVPSARIVLLRTADETGFTFFTNYDSRKGTELAANRRASLLFYWAALERQVRVEGVVERIAAAESDAYFASRPYDSRIGAWASPQSAIIDDRKVLEKRVADVSRTYPEQVPRPPHWGGYRLAATVLEFWQGRPSRLHDRLRYLRLPGEIWERCRLAP
ncbi:MAG: pyridoxamine 5'-phosphate oxidase [Sterolibacteriaceae bacterium]|nr:pyridoxamine 5'-phosphate oxidase [Candidatus Methylophosphatis haderslevensis]